LLPGTRRSSKTSPNRVIWETHHTRHQPPRSQSRQTQPNRNESPRHNATPKPAAAEPKPAACTTRSGPQAPLPRTKPILTSVGWSPGWSEATSRSDGEAALDATQTTSNTQLRGSGRPVQTGPGTGSQRDPGW